MMIRKILFTLILISVPMAAATVHGSVYRWNDLKEVPALIQVEQEGTLIHQEVINSSGLYSLDLNQGNYTLYGSHSNLTAKQEIQISVNGSKQIDLVLTPGMDYVFPDTGELPEYEGILGPEEDLDNGTGNETVSIGPGSKKEVSDLTIYLAVLVFLVLFSLTYFLKRRAEKGKERHISSDEEEVLEVLEKSGGEAYQGDVKEEMDYSASKTSELLSKMEREGKIEREKKGRKKVVKLK